MTERTLKPADATAKLVELLTPFESDDRRRIVQAALTLLGEASVADPRATSHEYQGKDDLGSGAMPKKAEIWMRQNGVSQEKIQEAFHLGNGSCDVIAAIPGSSNKEKTLNAYILTGIASLLTTGEPNFDDSTARELCTSSGCYDRTNHATTLKGKGNDFTGSKNGGWTLTSPGLKKGANLIKALS